MTAPLKLYFNPQSRAVMARWILEEVGADYELAALDFQTGDNRKPDFLAINPMGKLPTLVLEDGTVITEAPAIIAWAADAYPQAGLAPVPGSAARGSYYRWLFFANGALEPAMTMAMMRKDAEPLPRSTVGWGSYDDVVDTLEKALAGHGWLTGEAFTAADLYLAAQLDFGTRFGAPRLKDSAAIQDFLDRARARPAYARAYAG